MRFAYRSTNESEVDLFFLDRQMPSKECKEKDCKLVGALRGRQFISAEQIENWTYRRVVGC